MEEPFVELVKCDLFPTIGRRPMEREVEKSGSFREQIEEQTDPDRKDRTTRSGESFRIQKYGESQTSSSSQKVTEASTNVK